MSLPNGHWRAKASVYGTVQPLQQLQTVAPPKANQYDNLFWKLNIIIIESGCLMIIMPDLIMCNVSVYSHEISSLDISSSIACSPLIFSTCAQKYHDYNNQFLHYNIATKHHTPSLIL